MEGTSMSNVMPLLGLVMRKQILVRPVLDERLAQKMTESRAQVTGLILGLRRAAFFVIEGEEKEDMCAEVGEFVGCVGCP